MSAQSQPYDPNASGGRPTAPPSPATPADPATNRLTGYTYDNNGNAYLSGGQYYDAENRLIETNNFDTRYGYDSRNKRIWKGTYTYNGNGGYNQTAAQVFFYGLDGKKLGTYTTGIVYGGQGDVVPQSIAFNYAATNTYFAGRMVQQSGATFIEDRLGSNGKYFPYGEERNYPALPNDQVKFATYTRDSATGLDYADQRYYSSVLGRFLTPDPYAGSSKPSHPRSWNLYSYADDDPTNNNDPDGRTCVAQGGFWVDNGDGSGCSDNGQPTGNLLQLMNNPTFVEDVWGEMDTWNQFQQGDPADISECTVSQLIMMDCDSSQAMAAAAGKSWWTAYGVASWWAAVRLIGEAGEATVSDIIGLARNVGPGRFTVPNGNSFVIPDFVDQATQTIYEVKNMTAPGVTAQLTAFASWAQQTGYRFVLYLNTSALGNLSQSFLSWVKEYNVDVEYFDWP